MKKLNLELNEEDLRIIENALMDLPFKIVAPLIGKINDQLISAENSASVKSE